ncbi:MAG TPA: gamma-glutamyltransferase [Bryobacteraceae bacterium]|nr:gamma-glutamyltransferase [Bryobacteraceae bacterium]
MTLQRRMAAIVICVQIGPSSGFGTDLSPNKWKPDEKARVERAEMIPAPSQARVVEGKSGLVAATMSPIAVLAGLETLRQGGSAADAAATVALTQITTALGSYVSYAGILQLVYFDAKSGKVYSLNSGWGSYVGETDPKSIPVSDLGSLPFARRPTTAGAEGRKTLVPGFMAGIEAMHKRFGHLPFATLFQPAIAYAEGGLSISPLLASYFSTHGKFLARTAEGRAFEQQAGSPLPKVGDRFTQTELAKTLRGVARNGAGYMYTGTWGQQYVQAVQRNGGAATLEDMKHYRPVWEEPQSTSFFDHTIYAPGRSNNSGTGVLEALNLAEATHLEQMGAYYKDAQAFRTLSQILRVATYDGAPDPQLTEWKRKTGLSSAPGDRLTKTYAKALASVLDEVGNRAEQDGKRHSDAVVVIDRRGNVAALVHSINTVPWGTTGIVVGGIPISDAAGFQQMRMAAIKPGDLLPQDESPVIAIKGGKPDLAIATIGVSLLPETVRLLVGVLANHLDPLTAMAAPPLLLNLAPMKSGEGNFTKPDLVPAGVYDQEFLKRLHESGVPIEQKTTLEVYGIKGTAVLGTIGAGSGVLRTVETPRVFGFAGAY